MTHHKFALNLQFRFSGRSGIDEFTIRSDNIRFYNPGISKHCGEGVRFYMEVVFAWLTVGKNFLHRLTHKKFLLSDGCGLRMA